MNEGRIGTDGKRRPPLSADELINELRPHGRRLSWLRWLIFWRIGIGNIVAYVFIVAAFVVGQVQDSEQRGDLGSQAARADTRAARTTAALCALRHDLEKRVVQSQRTIAQSEEYLAQHPHGIPGIPAATIRQGLANQREALANQQRTIDALSSLSC